MKKVVRKISVKRHKTKRGETGKFGVAGVVLALTSFLAASAFIAAQLSFDDGFAIQQLTSNAYSKAIGNADNGKLVWAESRGNGRQIFLYDGAQVKQLTFDEYPRRHIQPTVDGDYVVWIMEGGTVGAEITPQIFLYQISTRETTQITNNPLIKSTVDMDDGKITWTQHPAGPVSCSQNIVLYDIATQHQEIIVNDQVPFECNDRSSVISGNTLAWQWSGGSSSEVFMKDLSTGEITRLTNNGLKNGNIQVSDPYVAWTRDDGNDDEIFLYDGTSITQLTDNEINDIFLELNGDKVVWYVSERGFPRIGIYTVSTQSLEFITDATTPDTDGVNVIWTRPFPAPDMNRLSREVFVKTATGTITQITEEAFVLGYPVIGNDLIAWIGQTEGPGGDQEIFIAFPFEGNTPPGDDVSVVIDDVTLTYPQVDTGGDTTVTTSSSGTQPPTGFKLGNPAMYYNISTTAMFSGLVEVCVNYDETSVQGNENNLKLMHFVTGQGWIDTTASLDTVSNIICGKVTSFSEFSVMTEETIDGLIETVEAMNLQSGITKSLTVKLAAATKAIESGRNIDIKIAVNMLNAFINNIEAQRGKKLTDDQANELRAFAENIIESLTI